MENDIFDLLCNDRTETMSNGNTSALESDADRAFVIMAALKEACTPTEFEAIMDDRTALEAYGVIPTATTAMEGVEKRIARYTMTSKLSQATKAACLRLAREAGDPNYEKYRIHRIKMFEFREKIYQKYENKARRVAKDIIRGAKNGSTAMKTQKGKSITDKLEKAVKKIENEGKVHTKR